jgi:hypothetical protein
LQSSSDMKYKAMASPNQTQKSEPKANLLTVLALHLGALIDFLRRC